MMPEEKPSDEARSFEENGHRLLKRFEQAEREGALRIGEKSVGITVPKEAGVLRKPPSQKVMPRIPVEDLKRARRHAAAKGIGYQTYIKMLLHEGLEREERMQSR